MSEHNNQTLAKDIRDLAQALLDNAETGAIIRSIGPDENLPEADLNLLLDLADSQPFMQRFSLGSHYNEIILRNDALIHMARRLNPFIAIAVARGVAAGRYSSADDEQATKLITINMVPWDEYLEGISREENWRPRWHRRKLSFDEYYEVLAEVWPDRKFQKALTKAIKALAKVHGDYLDRYTWRPAREALEDIPYMAMLRRGWVSGPRFWSAAMYVKEQNLDMEDKSVIQAFFSAPSLSEGPSRSEFHNIDFGGKQ